jgi:hypothetical protein
VKNEQGVFKRLLRKLEMGEHEESKDKCLAAQVPEEGSGEWLHQEGLRKVSAFNRTSEVEIWA